MYHHPQQQDTIFFLPTDEIVRQTTRQQRWLVFMRNCAICLQRHDCSDCGKNATSFVCLLPPEKSDFACRLPAEHCDFGKRLWAHIIAGCVDQRCRFPRCVDTRGLLRHFHICEDECCPVCAPVKELFGSRR